MRGASGDLSRGVVEAGAHEGVRLEAEGLLQILEDAGLVPLLRVVLDVAHRPRAVARLLRVAFLARLDRGP